MTETKKCFLNYSRDEIINENLLQYIKHNFKDMYCDFFDNKFTLFLENGDRQFSSKAIGYCLENLKQSSSVICLKNNLLNFQSINMFTLIEILISLNLDKPIYILDVNSSDIYNKDGMEIINSIELLDLLDLQLLIEDQLKTQDLSIKDRYFLAYSRNNNENYISYLELCKELLKEDVYIDCLDNICFSNEKSKHTYSAFNPNCNYSKQIFDDVIKNLFISNKFCYIASNDIYKNHFVKLQYDLAKLLNKEIYFIEEQDFFNVILNKVDFNTVCKKADLKFADIEFSKFSL